MQIIQHREHTDKISLQQSWCALQFINWLSFSYYDLEIGLVSAGAEVGEAVKYGQKYEVLRWGIEVQDQCEEVQNDRRAHEVPVRYLLRHKDSNRPINGRVRPRRFQKCRHTVAEWKTVFSICISFIAETKNPQNVVLAAEWQDFFIYHYSHWWCAEVVQRYTRVCL